MRNVMSGERLGSRTLAIVTAAALVCFSFAGGLDDFRAAPATPRVGGLMVTSSCANAVCPRRIRNMARKDATIWIITLMFGGCLKNCCLAAKRLVEGSQTCNGWK